MVVSGKNPSQLRKDEPLQGIIDSAVPYFFLGHEAFGLRKYLLRPFGRTHLTVEKRIINYRLSRAQRYVECALGILTNKWPIFHRSLNVQPDFTITIVSACIVLHNFMRNRD